MTVLTRRSLLGGAAAATAASSVTGLPAHAAAPLIGKQGPSFYRYKIGDFEVTALNEGVVRNATPANMAVNKTLPDVQKALGDAFLPTDHVINQFNILVVNTGRNLVLIDSGFGDNGPPTVGSLVEQHDRRRHRSEEHRHNPGQPFPRRPHFRHPRQGGRRELPQRRDHGAGGRVEALERCRRRVESAAGLEGRLRQRETRVRSDRQGREAIRARQGTGAGHQAVDARGHSPGHTAFLVASGNGKLLVTSDTVNHQILIRNPEWSFVGRHGRRAGGTTRKRLLDMAAADKMQIAAYHLPFPSTGFITKQGNGYEFHPASWQPVL